MDITHPCVTSMIFRSRIVSMNHFPVGRGVPEQGATGTKQRAQCNAALEVGGWMFHVSCSCSSSSSSSKPSHPIEGEDEHDDEDEPARLDNLERCETSRLVSQILCHSTRLSPCQ